MGTRMVPSYANLYLGALEHKILSHKPLVWLRYIDDIFAIWTHGKQLLENFISNINNHHSTIKFTATFSGEVIFLDTRVYIKGGHLKMDLHVKDTDTNQYLHATIVTLYTAKQQSPSARHYDSNKFAQVMRILKREHKNW